MGCKPEWQITTSWLFNHPEHGGGFRDWAHCVVWPYISARNTDYLGYQIYWFLGQSKWNGGGTGTWCRLGDNQNNPAAIDGGATGIAGRYPLDSNLGSNFKVDTTASNGPGDFWCPKTTGGFQGPRGFSGGNNYCYNNLNAIIDPVTFNNEDARRWEYNGNGSLINLDNCKGVVDDNDKQACKDDPDALALLGKCWRLKKKCLFSPGLCNNCTDTCDGENFNCCSNEDCENNPSTCGGVEGNCCQGRCCQRVGLIYLDYQS